MPIQATQLLLSSTSTLTYETIRDRVYTANAAKVSYTPTNTELQLNATDTDVSDLFLIDCLVPNDERTATNAAGDLSSIHRDNIDTAFFRMELSTDEDISLIAPDLLNRTGRNVRFVRQGTATGTSATATGYGGGHGKTWRDAFDGFHDTASIGANWATNTTYYICGFIVGVQDNFGGGTFIYDLDPDFQDATGAPTRHRMDYALDPGMQALFSVDIRGSNNEFTQPHATSHPRVWKGTFSVAGVSGRRWLTPIDMTLSTSEIYENHMFKDVSSLDRLLYTPMSRWEDGSDLWIHMPDDTDPTHRIGGGNPDGFEPRDSYMDATTAKEDLEFILCQYVGNNTSAHMSSNSIFPKAKFLSGRYLHGASWKPRDVCIDGTTWGESARGNVTWDTSDRPDPETQVFIKNAVAKGSSQKRWDRMPYWLEIDSASEGIYWAHSGVTSNPDDGTIDGVLMKYIGTAHPVILDKYGSARYDDGDSHAWAHQGGSGWDVGYVFVLKAGSAFNLYAISDSTNAQSMENNIVHDFVICNSHGKYSVQVAGMNAIKFNGDGGAYPRVTGSGNYTGNKILRGCIANMIGDPDGTAFGSPGIIAGGGGIIMHLIEELLADSIHFVNCTHDFEGQRSADMSVGDGSVANPLTGEIADPQVRAKNCTFENTRERIIYARNTKWDATPLQISSISNDNPAVVTTATNHGYPDISATDVFVEPRIYIKNVNYSSGTALEPGIFEATVTGVTTFTIADTDGNGIDGTALGTFASGDCGRANIGYYDFQDNEIILKDGLTATDYIYRYNNGDLRLDELQSTTRNALPGANNQVLEAGTEIV